MHHGVRTDRQQDVDKSVELLGEVEVDEVDLVARDLLPCPDAFADRADRRQRLDFEFDVDVAPAQIVNDGYFVAEVREVE